MKLAPCLLVLALVAASASARTTIATRSLKADAVTITPATASEVFLVDPADQSFDISTKINIPPGVPVGDVVFLSDTTGSMGGAINNVKTNILSIISSVQAQIPDVQFGVGEYKDVVDSFVYKTNTALTSDSPTVQAAVNSWSAGGGGDTPEGQLFALHCVATGSCGGPATPMGFRSNAVRILVWFGDAPGTDPTNSITEDHATADLQAAKIQVIAINVGNLDATGQATRITAATSGSLKTNDAATLAQAIIDAIKALPRPVSVSTTCDTGLTATYTPSAWTVPGSETSTELSSATHVTLAGGTAAGVYECTTSVLINDVVVEGVSQVITVRANRKPDCAAAQLVLDSPLFPNDHTMVGATVAVGDPDGDTVTVTIDSVLQSEPSKGAGTGNTCPDATLSPLALRREKAGTNKGGRIYKVSFTATDEYDASCTGTVYTCVPHDQGQGAGCNFDQAVTQSPACPA